MGWFDRLRLSSAKDIPGPLRDDKRAAAPIAETSNRSNGRGWSDPRGAAFFPRFLSSAGDQLDPKLSNRFADVRIKLRNAFSPSQPVTDRRMFAGRADVLTALIRAIEHQRLHCVIYGERGIGKTSLVHVLAQAARDARYFVAYIPCGVGSHFDEVFRALAAEIPLLYHTDYGPTSAEAERRVTLAEVLPAGVVSARLASDTLAKVTGTRVLVVLDEFDRCESDPFRLAIAEFLKNLSDRSARVQLVIAGVAGNLTELIERIPSIQRNVFALQLPNMTEPEIRHLVKNGEECSGLRFDEAAIRFVVAVANGFPYLASLLSHHAGLTAIDENRTTVTVDDISAAISVALGEFKGRISKRSQVQVDAVVRDGMARFLGPLSGTAQSSSGRFDRDDIGALFSDPEHRSKCLGLVEDLAAGGILLGAREDDNRQSYSFLEESVPSYLWLLDARARFLGNKGQGVTRVAPEQSMEFRSRD